jgi:hypothetical protein
MYFFALIHHWKQPLAESFAPLQHASQVGMDIGDVENGLISFTFYASHFFYHGRPLSQVEEIFNDAILRIRQFRQDSMHQAILPILQFIHNLTGRAPEPKVLSGSAMPLFEVLRNGDSQLIPYCNYCLGAELAFMFDDLDLAYQMLEKKRNVPFEPMSFYYYTRIRFKEALICIAMLRKGVGIKKKNKQAVNGVFKQLMAWSKDCPQNYLHKLRLVEAELKSLSISSSNSTTQKRRVQDLYDEAIVMATSRGFVDEAAVANELASYFMRRIGRSNRANRYMEEAKLFYLQWGATEKLKHLAVN